MLYLIFSVISIALVASVPTSHHKIVKRQDFLFHQHPQLIRQPAVREKDKGQDLSKIPGRAGVDFPLFHEVPQTSFSCEHAPAVPGMYADVETGCQAYHVCDDNKEAYKGGSFLCTNGTLFSQKDFTCDWWYNVNCGDAPHFYGLNADPRTNPYTPKEKLHETIDLTYKVPAFKK